MKNKKSVFIWSLYDFANSSYAVIIVAFVYAVYFTEVICESDVTGTFLWSLGINISMITVALINPYFGAIADYTSKKKLFLGIFSATCITATALMFFTGRGDVTFGLILFIISNIGFQGALTFYDAFIPEIADENDYNKVSGTGYAVGYLGSLFAAMLVIPFRNNPEYLFLITALLFTVFSLPLFLFLKEHKLHKEVPDTGYFKYGFKKVFHTIRNIKKYKNLAVFLTAFFFYIDAINTIIYFAGIYASSILSFEIIELAYFFIIVQFTAMIGSFLFGMIGDRIGIKLSIIITLIFWTLIVIGVFLINDKTQFFIIGSFAGTFLGATQSLSRALMSKLIPFEFKTEFFGFYSLFEKTSTILGPLLFGLITYITGNMRIAVLSVGVFIIAGMIIIFFVKEKKEEIQFVQ